MSWIILGILFLIITVWSLKGANIVEYNYKKIEKVHHVTVWKLIILFIIYCLPVIGIMAFVAYNILFFMMASTKIHNNWKYYIIELSNKNFLHRILGTVINILTKEI